LNRQNIPLHGVYACRADIVTAQGEHISVRGAANIGYRPSVSATGAGGVEEAWLEVHLLDFDKDIYDAQMRVVFCRRIRAEQKFESLQALTQQIARDVQQVRAYFESGVAATPITDLTYRS
jgi:riboflavin kinase/FMN adenylyltransferase